MKKEPIKAILFDLDGTLLYTLEDIRAAINVPLVNRGVSPITIEECRKFVGKGLRNSVKFSFEVKNYKADDGEIDKALEELLVYYKENPTKFSKPYDKILEILDSIDIPFGLLSNKDDTIVKQIVSEVFNNTNFDFVCGAKDGILKPSKDRVIEFSNLVNIPATQILYVGDSDVDYKTAENANTQVLLVTWGYRDKEDLAKLNAPMVDNSDELWRFIDESNKSRNS